MSAALPVALPVALTAIYGGAFDPIHNGHLAVALAAAHTLDAVVHLVPTGDPRHRPPAHARAVDRVAMLRLAIGHEPRLRVDTREIDRVGASYTVDTLEELRAALGASAPLAMIVGADAFLGLPSWSRWQQLFALAHVVVAERPGNDLHSAMGEGALADAVQARWTDAPAALHAVPAGRVLRLALPLRPESSSGVRAAVASGVSIDAAVPVTVARYIAAHGLYR